MPPRLVSNRIVDLFQQDRPGGRHVSSAIFRVMQALHPDRYKDEPINEVRALLGNALENAVAEEFHKRFPHRYVRPGTLYLDGLHGTPDLWDLGELTDKSPTHKVVEIKLTWASSRRAEDPEDPWFWRYWTQGKSYCKMSGFDTVSLIVVYVVGDWRDGPPVGYHWDWTFPQDEIDETWEMIKANATHEEGSRRASTSSNKGSKKRVRQATDDEIVSFGTPVQRRSVGKPRRVR